MELPSRKRYFDQKRNNVLVRKRIPKHKFNEAKRAVATNLAQFDHEVKTQGIQTLHDKIEHVIYDTINKFGIGNNSPKTDDKLSTSTKEMTEKRNRIAKKANNKSPREKLELLMLKRKVKNEIRRNVKAYDEEKTLSIIEENGSIKKISKGKNLVLAMKNKKGEATHNRLGIV